MEVLGKSMVAMPTNVIYLSTILGQDGPNLVHKCDWKCQNEHVCGNMYRCRLTGLTHICDKNCNQRILYDNHNSLCRVSKQIFPLTQVEVQAVKGVRRKFDADSSPSDSCAFKRRRDAHFHPSPFERSFTVICDLPRGLDFEQIESAISLELLNMDRSVEESNNCQIKWCLVTTLKCDCPAVSLVKIYKVNGIDHKVSFLTVVFHSFVLVMSVGLALVNIGVIISAFPTEMSSRRMISIQIQH